MKKKSKKQYFIYNLDKKSVNLAFLISFCIFLIINFKHFTFLFTLKNFLIFIACNFIFLIMHEFLHFLGYILGGADKNKIKFGIKIEKGLTYAICQDKLSKKSAIRALLLPFIVLGFMGYIIGIISNNSLLILLSIFTMIGGVGDIILALFLKKLPASIQYQERDNPLEFLIIHNHNKIYYGFGIEFKEKINNIKINTNKLEISNFSKIILSIFIILGFLYIIK